MRKVLLACLSLLMTLPSIAQYNGDGYYRVKNYMTERYAYIRDNKGSVDVATTSVDLAAIKLYKDLSLAIPDPSSVIYIESQGDSEYDLQAQGTGVYEIIGMYVKLRTNSDGTYYCYATYSGVTRYIGDAETTSASQGVPTDAATGDYRKWNIAAIDSDGDNYFGVEPVYNVGDKYYTTMYAEFAFSFASSGMKAYKITNVGSGMAVLEEITDDIIPGETPVIIECSSSDPSDNRLNIYRTSDTAPSDNLLVGVYFQNTSLSTHYNQVEYDEDTMRMLGVLEDGSLGFVMGNSENLAYARNKNYVYTYFIPANTCYLSVPTGTAEELKLVDEEAFEEQQNADTGDDSSDDSTGDDSSDDGTGDDSSDDSSGDDSSGDSTGDDQTGIVNVKADHSVVYDAVYNIFGVKVLDNVDEINTLPAGIYISKGRVIVVK